VTQPPQPPPEQPWGPQGGQFPQPAWQPPPKQPKMPLLVGMLIGAVAPWLLGVVPLILTNGNSLAGYGLLTWAMVPLVGFALIFADQTRRWGLGILLGFFGMLVIGAGACVIVLVGLTQTGA
jgi:hypothetical protein